MENRTTVMIRTTKNIRWVDRDNLFDEASKALENVEVVLDIGCGIYPQKLIQPRVHICFEPFLQYVEYLQEKVKNEIDKTYVIVNGDWNDAVTKLAPKSVDTIILSDVIEHLKKEDGKRLLAESERIARRQIAIFTPLGFVPQDHPDGKDAWGLNGGSWQKHLSGWNPEKDFDSEWVIIGSKHFHLENNKGEPLEKPWGAFWAIKTLEPNLPPRNIALVNLDKAAIFARSRFATSFCTTLFKCVGWARMVAASVKDLIYRVLVKLHLIGLVKLILRKE